MSCGKLKFLALVEVSQFLFGKRGLLQVQRNRNVVEFGCLMNMKLF